MDRFNCVVCSFFTSTLGSSVNRRTTLSASLSPFHSVFNVKYVDILNRFIQSMCLCVCVAGDLT